VETFDIDDPIPELLKAEWPHEKVLALFSDLAAGAEIQNVQLRTKNSDTAVTLAQARTSFALGEALAIQIRYRFEGELWSDTIMPSVPLSTIVRNRLPG
jgi:hypothetical protein